MERDQNTQIPPDVRRPSDQELSDMYRQIIAAGTEGRIAQQIVFDVAVRGIPTVKEEQ